MQLISLDDEMASYLIEIDGFQFMIDCPNVNCIHQKGLKIEQLDVFEIDCILISNHEMIYALPYLTERLGYTGPIYATLPTMEFGKLLVVEMVEMQKLKYAYPVQDGQQVENDVVYTREEIDNCFDKVRCIQYNQNIFLPPCLNLLAISSGYSIGACNWVLRGQAETCAFVSKSNSATTRLPARFNLADLNGCDTMVMSSLNADMARQSGVADTIKLIQQVALKTLEADGNLIISCTFCGVMFDVLLAVYETLANSTYTKTRVYYLSPVATKSMQVLEDFEMWLNSTIQPMERTSFIKQELKCAEYLHTSDIARLKENCIVFVGDAHLQYECTKQLINHWKSEKANRVLLTDPSACIDSSIHSEMTMDKIPLDARLIYEEANQLILACQPRHLMVPHSFLNTSDERNQGKIFPLSTRFQSTPENAYLTTALQPYVRSLNVPKNDFVACTIQPSLSHDLELSTIIDNEVSGCAVLSEVRLNNGLYQLHGTNTTQQSKTGKKKKINSTKTVHPYTLDQQVHIFGCIDVKQFVKHLEKHGFENVSISSKVIGTFIITIPNLDCTIETNTWQTKVKISDELQLRRLQPHLLSCLLCI